MSGSQYSPAQILMSRRLRDKLLCAASALNPRVVQDGPNLAKRQQRQKHFYDRSAKQRQSPKVGDNVRIRLHDTWDKAVVTGKSDTPRSHIVTTENGQTYRRNEHVINPSFQLTCIMPPIMDDVPDDHDNHDQEVPPDIQPDSTAVNCRPTANTHSARPEPMLATMPVTPPTRERRNKQATYWHKDYQMNAMLVYQ